VDGIDGVNGASDVVVSPDGKHVYAVVKYKDAVVVLSRDSVSGELKYSEMIKDGVDNVDGLLSPHAATVSPDGRHVYVLGVDGEMNQYDDVLSVFSRDPSTGQLSFVEMIKDDLNGIYGATQSLSVAVSPDGKNVYVSGYEEDAIFVFSRDATSGRLSLVETLKNIDGLNGTYGIAVSPDGNHVYAKGWYESTIAVFSRNAASGRLTLVEMLGDNVGGSTNRIPASTTVSPDGDHVYITDFVDDSLIAYSRDQSSGSLTYVETLRDGVEGIDGLRGVLSVTISPDGSHLYAASKNDDAVAIFRRDASSGRLFTSPCFATALTVSKDSTELVR